MRVGALRFGKAELRVILIQLGVWVAWFLVYMVGIFFIAIVGGLLTKAVPVLGVIVTVIGFVVVLCLMVWLPVRLAPAAALTINQNKRHLLAANKVTKHRFWNLFLAYLVIGVLGYLVLYAVLAICLTLVTGDSNFMMAMSGFGSENPRDAFEAAGARLKNPVFLVLALIVSAVYTALMSVWLLCLAGVGTYAVKWWRDEDQAPAFD